jgi:hypothetical protein
MERVGFGIAEAAKPGTGAVDSMAPVLQLRSAKRRMQACWGRLQPGEVGSKFSSELTKQEPIRGRFGELMRRTFGPFSSLGE